ncbi:MAG: winged helix-turn-helix transcriptional regulator, partial [Euryarchaeota archaeon]|nr:winged helix-turn-helix transcriptional regulator [Euryarchaeota archaeon]
MAPKREEREILEILEKDARATPRAIAAQLGVPEARVREAVGRLESQGAIRSYRAVVD